MANVRKVWVQNSHNVWTKGPDAGHYGLGAVLYIHTCFHTLLNLLNLSVAHNQAFLP